MKIGLQVPAFNWGAPEAIAPRLAEIARAADDAGFYSLWVMDHFFQIRTLGPPEDPMLEGYSTLGYLVSLTTRLRLGTLVTGAIYRFPGVLVKTVTTLDVLSGGRMYFGIGAAWNEQESRGLGVPFPRLRERFQMLEETLRIARQMWIGDRTEIIGTHYALADPLNVPQSLSRPHPPILVGGGGEQKTLRLVAHYADACNLFARIGRDALLHKLDVLRRHCEAAGRPYEDIERTTLGTVHLAPGAMTAADVIAECRSQAGLGIQHAIFNMPNVHELRPIEVFASEIIPAVAEL